MNSAHILIVEDDPIASAMLCAWARQQGAVVTAAESTHEAEQVLTSGRFDLVVSDVHLPGNQRLSWVEKLLSADMAPPIVLITGNPELETTLRAANLPVAGYLVKPPDLAALTRLAQSLITGHRHRRELHELSRDVAGLLTVSGSESAPVRDRLLQLSRLLSAESSRTPRSSPTADDGIWRSAIAETVTVLERTKHSFRSKDLGQLRQRLQRVLDAAA